MTRYGREMMASTRRPPLGAGWFTFVVTAVGAIVLAVFASREGSTTAGSGLWIASLVLGTLAIGAWYALAIDWARRRKRLWG
ncbi:hypothetical protein [Gordonia terrae]